jgi:kinesin family protein 2/24
MEQFKVDKAAEEQRNRDSGVSGDVDFIRMIKNYREKNAPEEMVHLPSVDSKICICVRKRPISVKEVNRNDNDSVTCTNPMIIVHDCKLKVDGISKYLDNTSFEFDHTFHEDNTTDNIYDCAVQSLVDFVVGGGRATVFAYGQTGSGKTYTMQGIQSYVADDLFALLQHHEEENGTHIDVYVSYFEIYGGRCQDLLNSRQRLNVREDGAGEVVVSDLMELQADTVEALHNIIETGNRNRTTHATESNEESSRSHAICQIALKKRDHLIGRFSLIDLAGSERGADTKSHNRQRRMEGAEINKSLLALKECIRALDNSSSHVPYRASKLTLVLKDSFTNKKSRTVMIVNVSPAASSADHTLNTLRYADRIKERTVGGQAAAAGVPAPAPAPPQAIAKQPASGNARRNSSEDGNFDDAKPVVSSRGASPLPPPVAQPPSSGKDRNVRNKEISKVLADNIAAPKAPSSAREADAKSRQQFKSPPPSNPASNGSGQRAKAGIASGGGGAGNRNGRVTPADDSYDDDSDGARYNANEDLLDDENSAFHRTVQDVFDEEEDLLNLHMSIIQENAELLTEEGRLLQQIQGENNDIDAYAARLDAILQRKQELIGVLRKKLDHFRLSLQREERESQRMLQKGGGRY